MIALINVQSPGISRDLRARRPWRSEVRVLKPGLTFGSFGYKGTGFASFTSKKKYKIYLYG
jgi:hypothetical protein